MKVFFKFILLSVELVFSALLLFWVAFFFINIWHIIFISYHITSSNFLTFVLNLHKIHFFSIIILNMLLSLFGLFVTHKFFRWL